MHTEFQSLLMKKEKNNINDAPGEFHGLYSPWLYSPWGHKESNTTERI